VVGQPASSICASLDAVKRRRFSGGRGVLTPRALLSGLLFLEGCAATLRAAGGRCAGRLDTAPALEGHFCWTLLARIIA
jgi:hypothetical protein